MYAYVRDSASASELSYKLKKMFVINPVSSIFRNFRKSCLPFYWKYFFLLAKMIDVLLI